MDKHQLVIIDGGNSFDTDAHALEWLENCKWDLLAKPPSWKKWLSDGLADDFALIRPDMPNTMNAKYNEWKVWFEKYFPYLREGDAREQSTLDRVIEKSDPSKKSKLVLLGHSLGATFLVKYLTENLFPRHIDTLHLIAPAYDDTGIS